MRRERFWGWYAVAGVLIVAGEFTRRLWNPGYGYVLIVAGLALWIIYVLLDGFSPIERERRKRPEWKTEKTITADDTPERPPIQPADDGRPTMRRRAISGILMACVFGGAKWSDVPSADGVFWVVVAIGFAFGWSGSWL